MRRGIIWCGWLACTAIVVVLGFISLPLPFFKRHMIRLRGELDRRATGGHD